MFFFELSITRKCNNEKDKKEVFRDSIDLHDIIFVEDYKMKKALAFDIGGTKIYSTIIDETGKIISEINKFQRQKLVHLQLKLCL